MEANELTEDFLGTSVAALVADGELALALTPPTFDRLPFTFLNIFCFYKDDKIFALETICLWVKPKDFWKYVQFGLRKKTLTFSFGLEEGLCF